MRVALVHDFLTQLGGAERLLEVFHEIFPEAPVFTLVYDEQSTNSKFKGWDIRPSYLQNFTKLINYKWLLPLMPRAIESFDLTGFDLVLSDSSAFAKGIRVRKPAVHVCYCHTPTRYLWQEPREYVATQRIPFFLKPLVNIYLMKTLKRWDFKAAQGPGTLIANSEEVRGRINKYYARDSVVLHPPVDSNFFQPSIKKESYFLAASRLEPYKRVDLVVDTFNELGLPLKVAGAGSSLKKLKSHAAENIEFLGRVSDEELRDLYSGARAFIFPALEDAGVMVLESLACGTPVIAYNKGGAVEFIQDSVNGVLFEEQSVLSLKNALAKFEGLRFSADSLRAGALPYGKDIFIQTIKEILSS